MIEVLTEAVEKYPGDSEIFEAFRDAQEDFFDIRNNLFQRS
jgi:hypothetical protein